jgi:hypothetical protein
MIFKDTLPFSLGSLKSLARTFKCSPKMDFDICGWSRAKYMEYYDSTDDRTNWRKYMIQDVQTLAEVFIGLETYYNKLECSMTNHLGLPGIAFEMVMKTCYGFNNIYRPKDPSMVALLRNATYGGRVVALKRIFNSSSPDDVLISLDANSLYPSAMCIGTYPIGVPKVLVESKTANHQIVSAIPHHFVAPLRDSRVSAPATPSRVENPEDTDDLENSLMTLDDMLFSLQNHNDGRSSEKCFRHYILTIEYTVPNIKKTLIPHRTEDGRIVYPSNDTYVGTYSDVLIREMIIDGYTINKVINGIYWTRSEQLFTNLITYLYNERTRLKLEKNSFEYVIKIVLNAMYGKNMETVKTNSFFNSSDVARDIKNIYIELPNGQLEVTQKYLNPKITKPLQLGIYILDYSKAIMNEYIRKIGIDNVYYSDTDSIYVTRKSFIESGIPETQDLGGMKNDYGTGTYITNAIFLDQKRYFLKKFDESTFNKQLEIKKSCTIDNREPSNEETSILKTDCRKITAKYVGMSFKDSIENLVILDDGCVKWTEEQKISVEEMYKEIYQNYDEYIVKNPITARKHLEDEKRVSDTIEKIKKIANRWKRTHNGVMIVPSEIQYSIMPCNKGRFINNHDCGQEFTSYGFDENAEIAYLCKSGGKSVKEFCYKFPQTNGMIMTNKKGGKTVKSNLPLTSPIVTPSPFLLNPRAKKVDCDINDRFKVPYYIWVRSTDTTILFKNEYIDKKINDIDNLSELVRIYGKALVDKYFIRFDNAGQPTILNPIKENYWYIGKLGTTIPADISKEDIDNLIPFLCVNEHHAIISKFMNNSISNKTIISTIPTVTSLDLPDQPKLFKPEMKDKGYIVKYNAWLKEFGSIIINTVDPLIESHNDDIIGLSSQTDSTVDKKLKNEIEEVERESTIIPETPIINKYAIENRRCEYIFKSGKKVGQVCGAKTVRVELKCNSHIRCAPNLDK